MKSVVSSFEPSSAGKRAREQSSSSSVSKKKVRLEDEMIAAIMIQVWRRVIRICQLLNENVNEKEKEQDIREDTFAIKDEAYAFNALPDKKLSQRTNKFVQEYNKKSLCMPRKQ